MGGPAPAVGDREHLVRGEEPEGGDRDRHAERHAEQHVVRVIDGQVQPGQAEQRDQDRHGHLRVSTGAARHDQAVHGAHQEDREDRHRGRGREYPPQLPMICTPYGRGRDSPK